MKFSRSVVAIVVCVVLNVYAFSGVVYDADDEYDFSAAVAHIEANLAWFMNNVVVMFEREGELLFRYEHGFTADTVEGVASASKLVSGAIVLALRDDGIFNLDDNVGQSQYVPIMSQHGKDFTIRQGYSMSSGLSTEKPYQRLPWYTLEQSVNLIALNATVEYAPGTAVWYDGSGMQVVGLVAERASGANWHTLADDYLFSPCEMYSSSFTQFAPNPAIAGGVRTSANDYMNLVRMIASGGTFKDRRVLSESSVEELFTDQNGDNPILYSPFIPGSTWYPYGMDQPTYGFGGWIFAKNPATCVIEEIISPGAWGTTPWIDRARGVYGVVFTKVPAGSQLSTEPTLQLLHMVRGIIDDADGDVNCDGFVDEADVSVIRSNWLAVNVPRYEGDINEDGVVNIGDLAVVASGWLRWAHCP